MNKSTFRVATSYAEYLAYEANKTQNENRSKGFERLENQHELASTLKYTKPCRNVAKVNGVYGVCTRPICTFAHSLTELQVPQCAFGNYCRLPNCRFSHPGESKERYYERTGISVPDLPETSENTRVCLDSPLKRCDAMIMRAIDNEISAMQS